MALLATQNITRAGLAPAFAAAAGGGDTFTPDGDTFIEVKNASGSSVTVTIVTPRTDAWGNQIADNVITVPATTGDRMIGPFPADAYADPTTGLASITYSAVTSVTVAVFKVLAP
jgi:hypothetical protein